MPKAHDTVVAVVPVARPPVGTTIGAAVRSTIWPTVWSTIWAWAILLRALGAAPAIAVVAVLGRPVSGCAVRCAVRFARLGGLRGLDRRRGGVALGDRTRLAAAAAAARAAGALG